jgi:hypothetical protein
MTSTPTRLCADAALAVADAIPGHHAGPVTREVWCERGRGPDLTSHRYARDLNEVKQLGARNSATRTAERTNIARFWQAQALVIWNDVLRHVALGLDLDESEAARDFALMNVAGADARIACWDAKYAFNFWRPVTAIQRADEDGNPATEADSGWTPLIDTPNHGSSRLDQRWPRPTFRPSRMVASSRWRR